MNKLILIEKILLLESKFGYREPYSILEPFEFDSSNHLQVIEAANRIATHLRLPPLNFYVSFTPQKENVGGFIESEGDNDVFIELFSTSAHDFEVVLALLAHEICHKFLQLNDLKLFPTYENEILTDATTVYTGLGKLSLNGCKKAGEYGAANGSQVSWKTKVGYLNRTQFAFLYRIVCEIRKTSKKEYTRGLCLDASREVRDISKHNQHYFNEQYFIRDTGVNEISERLRTETCAAQKHFAKLKRSLRYVEEIIMPSIDESYTNFHVNTKTKMDTLSFTEGKEYFNERHYYLKNICKIEEFKCFVHNVNVKAKEIETFKALLTQLIEVLGSYYPERFSEQNLNFLSLFECPVCKNKMKISPEKLAWVKCVECNYCFIVDTGYDENSESQIEPEKKEAEKGGWGNLKSRIWNYLSKPW